MLALGENDERIRDLVQLAQVEQPPVVAEAFVLDMSGAVTANAAEAGDGGGDTAGVKRVDETAAHGDAEPEERPCRVRGEEDVVQKDAEAEGRLMGDSPWPVPAGAIAAVQRRNGGDIDGGSGERHTRVERGGVDVWRNSKWPHEGRGRHRGHDRARVIRWQGEQRAVKVGRDGPPSISGHGRWWNQRKLKTNCGAVRYMWWEAGRITM